MKNASKTIAVTCILALVCLMLTSHAEQLGGQPAPSSSASQPTVIHIHHYYNPGSASASQITGYAPSSAWHYGLQMGSGAVIEPWKQDWGHLGFTGFLGQHGGGVDVTPDSFPVFVGLVVDTVTPDSPAAKMGLVPGDFILEINGVKVNNYKQVQILFEATEQNLKAPLTLEVWNPNTRRTQTIKAQIEA